MTGGEGRSVEIMAKCGGKTDCQIRDLRFVESAVEGGCDPEPCWGLGYTRPLFLVRTRVLVWISIDLPGALVFSCSLVKL